MRKEPVMAYVKLLYQHQAGIEEGLEET